MPCRALGSQFSLGTSLNHCVLRLEPQFRTMVDAPNSNTRRSFDDGPLRLSVGPALLSSQTLDYGTPTGDSPTSSSGTGRRHL